MKKPKQNQKQKIRVFSTPACPYCETLKMYLQEKGFEFEDVDVSSNDTAREELVEQTGQMGVPVVDINGEFIVGFERDKINKLLNIKD